jgi:hypothetical protein
MVPAEVPPSQGKTESSMSSIKRSSRRRPPCRVMHRTTQAFNRALSLIFRRLSARRDICMM